MFAAIPTLLAVQFFLGAADLRLAPDDPAPEEEGRIDFDLFGDTAASQKGAIDPALDRQVQARRSMLQTHQILGLGTLGLMAGNAVVGQLNYSDLYGRGGARTGDFLLLHRISSYATAGAFLTTAAFALFAPTPYERSGGFDTGTLHRIAVIGASAGLVTQVVLGFVAARSADAGNSRNLVTYATVHQAVGYTTLGLMSVAASVWLF